MSRFFSARGVWLARFTALAALVSTLVIAGQAQTPVVRTAAVTPEEASQLMSGWALLTEGKYEEAARFASQVLSRNPRSVAALALVIEADIARGGASAALGSYEAWLGARTLEEPGVLRRIARALLHEWARQEADAVARIEALRALALEGEPEALQVLATAAGRGSDPEARALASAGNPEAVKRLAAKIRSGGGPKPADIQALGESKNPAGLTPLVELLTHPESIIRAEAASALGRLGLREAIQHLQPLLKDPNQAVRLNAASALYRFDDFSGFDLLQEAARNPNAAYRRSAALLMASHPDPDWQALVRSLATDPDPAIRLDVARLIAPYDPELARNLLDALGKDPNIAIRGAAGRVLVGLVASDFTTLRRLLRSGDGLLRVRSADRILVLTR